MHVALVSFCPPGDGKSQGIVKKLVAASESRGNRVELIDGNRDIGSMRLTMFEYIAVVVKAPSVFSSRIPDRVGAFLSASGTIGGKKGCALVVKAGFRSERACLNLMDVLESEGVKIDYFDVVRSADHAAYAGTKIG